MLTDPVLIALLARAGGSVTLSAAELEAAESARVSGSRNPITGEITLRLEG